MSEKDLIEAICKTWGLTSFFEEDGGVIIGIDITLPDLPDYCYSVVLKSECPAQALIRLVKIIEEMKGLKEDGD